MKPRGLQDLDARGNLYKHPRAKCKGVYGFQGDLNPVGPEGSSYKGSSQFTYLEYSIVIFMNLIGPQQVSKCNRDLLCRSLLQ